MYPLPGNGSDPRPAARKEGYKRGPKPVEPALPATERLNLCEAKLKRPLLRAKVAPAHETDCLDVTRIERGRVFLALAAVRWLERRPAEVDGSARDKRSGDVRLV